MYRINRPRFSHYRSNCQTVHLPPKISWIPAMPRHPGSPTHRRLCVRPAATNVLFTLASQDKCSQIPRDIRSVRLRILQRSVQCGLPEENTGQPVKMSSLGLGFNNTSRPLHTRHFTLLPSHKGGLRPDPLRKPHGLSVIPTPKGPANFRPHCRLHTKYRDSST